MSLKLRLIVRFLIFGILLGAAFFLPAGGFDYWQGWVFLAVTYVPMALGTIYFYKHDRALLESRMRTKETVSGQKLLIGFLQIIIIVLFLLPGFDHRFGWSHVPLWLAIFSQAASLAGYVIIHWVMKVNHFASRVVEVQSGQQVISTGPYRWVRHPMYFGSLVIFLFMPLALGSYWTLVPAFLVVPIFVLRLLKEEKVLLEQLPGYSDYCATMRYHLVPYLW